MSGNFKVVLHDLTDELKSISTQAKEVELAKDEAVEHFSVYDIKRNIKRQQKLCSSLIKALNRLISHREHVDEALARRDHEHQHVERLKQSIHIMFDLYGELVIELDDYAKRLEKEESAIRASVDSFLELRRRERDDVRQVLALLQGSHLDDLPAIKDIPALKNFLPALRTHSTVLVPAAISGLFGLTICYRILKEDASRIHPLHDCVVTFRSKTSLQDYHHPEKHYAADSSFPPYPAVCVIEKEEGKFVRLRSSAGDILAPYRSVRIHQK